MLKTCAFFCVLLIWPLANAECQDTQKESQFYSFDSGNYDASIGADIKEFVKKLKNQPKGKLLALISNDHIINRSFFESLSEANFPSFKHPNWGLYAGNLAKADFETIKLLIVKWKPSQIGFSLDGKHSNQNKSVNRLVQILSKPKSSVRELTLSGDINVSKLVKIINRTNVQRLWVDFERPDLVEPRRSDVKAIADGFRTSSLKRLTMNVQTKNVDIPPKLALDKFINGLDSKSLNKQFGKYTPLQLEDGVGDTFAPGVYLISQNKIPISLIIHAKASNE